MPTWVVHNIKRLQIEEYYNAGLAILFRSHAKKLLKYNENQALTCFMQ